MRGGLGKSLLIAFLLLAIIPLALLAFLTYRQVQGDSSQKLIASLETMVALKEANLVTRVESSQRQLGLLASTLDLDTDLTSQLAELQSKAFPLDGLLLMNKASGEIVAGPGSEFPWEDVQAVGNHERTLIIAPSWPTNNQPPLATSYDWSGYRLIGLLGWDFVQQAVAGLDQGPEGTTTYLLTDNGLLISTGGTTEMSAADDSAIAELWTGASGSGAFRNAQGMPVFGAWRWNPELGIGLVVEQAQSRVLETGNRLTAVVVGGALAVALLTAAIAAVVTRRITRPLVQLTETAAWMARGDLDQKVTIDRHDEIGVLARAFNRMAADLRVLYGNLEAKVAERTEQLEAANKRIRHHAMQLALSAEVARVISSIRDVDELLDTVTELIKNAFELDHVAIYLPDEKEAGVDGRRAHGPESKPERTRPSSRSLAGRAMAEGKRLVTRRPATEMVGDRAEEMQPPVICELAIPLHRRDRLLGVLDLQSSRPADFGEDDQMVYQSLANQISIAIENAQVYAIERDTVRKLKELDRIQAEFLSNMSHALRTPLTSILGFSQVMLKELDGPLNEIQRNDLATIHDNGKQLLGMLDDMLELSQLELGTSPFAETEVDLGMIVEGVMATAQALAGGKPVQISSDIPSDLPRLQTDGQRLRQVLLALITNAVRFTEEGSIHLQIAAATDEITISVTETDAILSQADQARLFTSTPNGDEQAADEVTGFGLAISQQVVERLGGQIWLETEEGVGSTFTFALPLALAEAKWDNGVAGHVDRA
jgi:signal transduction histidine kinase